MKIIKTQDAPQAIGCYSQAIQTPDKWLFLSGQIGLDPTTMVLVEGGFEAQCHQVFKNMQGVLRAANFEFSNIVKLTIFLMNMDDFSVFNEIMKQYFKEPYPARSTIAVARLPKESLIEIEAIAKQ